MNTMVGFILGLYVCIIWHPGLALELDGTLSSLSDGGDGLVGADNGIVMYTVENQSSKVLVLPSALRMNDEL